MSELGDIAVAMIAEWGGERVASERAALKEASDLWAEALRLDGSSLTPEVVAASFMAGWHAALHHAQEASNG